jgi:D-threo-aldose 1-dehydrogenase
LGTSALGGLYQPVEEAAACATIQRALELEIQYFDTAPIYGLGNSEARLGKVLPNTPRDSFIIGTRVGRPIRTLVPGEINIKQAWLGTPPDKSWEFDFSFDRVMRSLDESLKRLKLDRVDILIIHDPDNETLFQQAMAGAYPAVDKLRREGVIGAIGVGVDRIDILAKFAREADIDCFVLPGRYTLLNQTALDDLLPLCIRRNISIINAVVYQSGMLADPEPGAMVDYSPASADYYERALRINRVCDRYQVPIKATAMQFSLAHPAVAAVLNGARSVSELEENVQMFEYPIPDDLWQELKTEKLIPMDAPVPGDQGSILGQGSQ